MGDIRFKWEGAVHSTGRHCCPESAVLSDGRHSPVCQSQEVSFVSLSGGVAVNPTESSTASTKRKLFCPQCATQTAPCRCHSVGRAPFIPQGVIVFHRAPFCPMGATRQSFRRRRSTQLSHQLHQLKGSDFVMRMPLCPEGANLSGECSSIHKAPVAIVSGGYRVPAPVRQ